MAFYMMGAFLMATPSSLLQLMRQSPLQLRNSRMGGRSIHGMLLNRCVGNLALPHRLISKFGTSTTKRPVGALFPRTSGNLFTRIAGVCQLANSDGGRVSSGVEFEYGLHNHSVGGSPSAMLYFDMIPTDTEDSIGKHLPERCDSSDLNRTPNLGEDEPNLNAEGELSLAIYGQSQTPVCFVTMYGDFF